MNIISFCLYGNTRKYTHGILEAVISYKLYFIEWEIWIYISEINVPQKVIDILKSINCKVILMKEKGSLYEEKGIGLNENNEPMFWRFLPLYDPRVNVFISRDADSRASKREKQFVDEFIESNKAIHSILDQGCHRGIMGGTCGFNNNILKKYRPIEHLDNFIEKNVKSNGRTRRGSDQSWLREEFKHIIENRDVFIHICDGIIKRNSESGKKFEDIDLIKNVKICNCQYKITESASNFIGQQHDVDNNNTNLSLRKGVFLPLIF